jgi:PEP-CTERM motif-containing protein
MKQIGQLLTAAFLLCAWTPSASADPVKITFDQPPCAPLATGVYSGDCYAGSGVTFWSDINGGRFTAPRIAIASDAHAVSPPNVARGVTGFTDVAGEFIVPGGTTGFTDFVAWNVTGSLGPGHQDPWEAFILGTNGNFDNRFSVLASITGFSDQLVSFSRPGRDIVGIFMSMGTAVQGMDNLSFNAPQATTPEPSTLLLIGTGLAALARRRRLTPFSRAWRKPERPE